MLLSLVYIYFSFPSFPPSFSFCVSSAATFDVQSVTAKGGSAINMTGRFISNSHAPGCFVVLQCSDGSPDEFRVLLRNNSDLIMTNMSVPPSTYKMNVHDLEEDGHINKMPAILSEDTIIVTRKCKLRTYMYLKAVDKWVLGGAEAPPNISELS